jgi:hypothetical protein
MQEPEVGEEVEWRDVDEKEDYSVKQEQGDKRIYLKCSDQKWQKNDYAW